MDMQYQYVSTLLTRFRNELGVTQAVVAQKAKLDQSRVSRLEKGEVGIPAEIERVLDALAELGSAHVPEYRQFAAKQWNNVEPPAFWNPQRACIEIAEDILGRVEEFLREEDRPWPLRRQIERHRDSLVSAATFLNRLHHNIAFVGDIGVGKSTAISFIFELLVPSALVDKAINRPILETGAGGTTICEVHIKRGPEFGLSLLPMTESELRDLVADFCAAKWAMIMTPQKDEGESVNVSREAERAIRNMSGLVRRRETLKGKALYHDPVHDLARQCASSEEFRTRVLELMKLPERTRRELWYDSGTRKHPMEWVTETFRAVNNGRLKDVSLPNSIDLFVPEFGRSFGGLEITVIDTKGVDDVAVREDLDLRLKDPRTAIVFCSRFNDAPGITPRALLQHMRQTFSERVDTGKVSILALPRAEEARAMKDDTGEQALTDVEGYEFKNLQVAGGLSADNLADVPMICFNVQSDDPATVRNALMAQLSRMRETAADRLFDLCAAVEEIIEHHETQALSAAVEEVAGRLSAFLRGNRRLGARECLAHAEALNTISGVRYASTIWASARRNGEYTGLNVVHQVGVGAARDAKARGDGWFRSLDAFLNSLKEDDGLALAQRNIDQIGTSATASRTAFLEAAQRAGAEVYREHLPHSPVWVDCVSEWGQGPGFKRRVVRHLEQWFKGNPELADKLEEILNNLWDQLVILPLFRLSDNTEPKAIQPGPLVVTAGSI